MGYDIRLKDPATGETLSGIVPHGIKGSTYVVGGTAELSVSVTHNYADQFRRAFGDDGINVLQGKTARDTVGMLKLVYDRMAGEPDDDYWAPTEGNAREAIRGLIVLATFGPDGEWDIS